MGKNCVLTYAANGRAHSFSAWGVAYAHGYELAATETVTRRQRAYYPRRVYPSQFTVTIALKANTTIDSDDRPVPWTSDYDRWGKFMAGYFNYMLEIGRAGGSAPTRFPGMMQVTMAGRNWTRYGIPLGASFGDHLASIFYTPTIVFETAIDPYDPATNFLTSWYDDTSATSNDPTNSPYFFPWTRFANGTRDQSVYDYEQLIDYRIKSSDVASSLNQATGQANSPTSYNPFTHTGDQSALPGNTVDSNQPTDGSTTTATTYSG